MESGYQRLDAYISENVEGWLEELSMLCAQPSVSARHEGIDACAALVAEMLAGRSFEAEVVPTAGHPVVVARAPGRSSKTMLFYNHYDVQPPEPLEDWISPPFEATRRDGCLFARGAKDDKGEFVARLAALDALWAVFGEIPCNATFLVEGEEEVGSVHLPEFVEAHWDALQADAAIWESGGVGHDGACELKLGMRGLLYVQLGVKTIDHDAHSGRANLLPNAAWRLNWALASLKNQGEEVLIPGFYDEVRPPSPAQRALLENMPNPEEALKREFGLVNLLGGLTGGEVPAAPFRPTCNIAGQGAGYQGPGSKTIVPAEAFAKIDFRLVPDQDPHDILEKLRRHLDSQGFDDISIEVMGAERPGVMDPEHPLVRLASETAEEVYGKPATLLPLTGGTSPTYLFLERGVPVVAPGIGYPDNRLHSPNEHIRVADFQQGVRHLARLIHRFST
jgi:acetylornithine deacetylase/succinyl-diaminopimelate desuccinylase-like protein